MTLLAAAIMCSKGVRAATLEKIILPLGRSATNEEQRPWRVALGHVLSKGNIMRLQLPLMVSQFTATIRRCDRNLVLFFGDSNRDCSFHFYHATRTIHEFPKFLRCKLPSEFVYGLSSVGPE